MEILFMVFMVVVSIMALFAVMVVLRDIVKEIIVSRRERDNNQSQMAAQATANVEVITFAEPEKVECEPTLEPIPEPVEEPAAEIEEPAAEEDDGKVSFAAGQQKTLDEKYLELPSEARGWYDEIIKHAAIVDGSKRFKNARYEEYKLGNARLVRLLIKRGIIHCEFILHNSDFKNYVNENKISVRQAPTTMRVESKEGVEAAKNSIDIVVAAIAEEKEYKKQLARERRKAAKAEAEATEAAASK